MEDDESPNFDAPCDDMDQPLDIIDSVDPLELPVNAEGGEGGENPNAGSEDVSVEILTADEVVSAPEPQLNRDRRTLPILTRYEKARVLGVRAIQLSHGASPLIETHGELNPVKIAELELQFKRNPLIVRRHLPDGTYEDWSVAELRSLV